MDVGRNSKKLCTITLILFLFVSLANGRTITVGTGLGYDYTTIQAAINAAQEGDTVIVAEGTYTEPVRFNGTNIVLTSTDPNDRHVNAEIEYDNSSVVTFTGEEDESCVLQGFTIRDGDSKYGGGIFGNGTRATIRKCHIEHNRAELGGGLYDCDGLIEDCVIEYNDVRERNVTNKGGGLYGCDGIINNCIIRDNEAGYRYRPGILSEGGGLHSCNGEIIGCTIANNYVMGNGGGLYGCNGHITDCNINENGSDDTGGGLSMCMGSVENCTIQNNRSPYWHGGGVANCNSFMNCLITGNAARGYGGGLYNCEKIIGCTISGNSTEIYPGGGISDCNSVVNCVVSGNFAGGNGGGLHNCREVVNCTIVGNYSMEQGGAVYYRCDYGIINNSIIWDNIAVDISQIFVECNEPNSALWNLSVDYSNIQGGLESVIVGEGCTLQWEPNNIDMAPLFAQPGSWTVENVWQEGDYHLLDDSPCIGAGDPNKDYTGQTDIDKQERVSGQYVDIGADEYIVPMLVQLELTGPQEVTEGDSAQYTVTAHYDDDSEIDFTNQVTWLVEPEGIGTLDATGLFTVGELDEPVKVIIKAEYVSEEVLYAAEIVVLCTPYLPTIYHVDTAIGNDENDGLSRETALKTIQRGINAARDGDTVLVYPGVYRELILFRGKAITLKSAEGAAVIENPNNFAVSFYYGEGPDSILKNFIIRDSFMGVFIAGSSPTISNLTIVGNKSGIEAYAGSEPDISNTILWNNTDGDLFGCQARDSWVQEDIQLGPVEGLIAYWKFDEDQGPIVYDSAGDNNGTIHGAQRTIGQVGGALSFDGEDDYVELPDNSPVWLPQYDFSLSVWVYFERDFVSTSGESEVILDLNFGASADPANELGYNIQRRGESGKLCFQMTTTTNSDEDVYSNEVLPTNTWHHIVAVRDGNIQAIYVNGQLDESRTCSVDPIDYAGGYDDDRVNLGRFTTNLGPPRYHLKGGMDDVMVFGKALSAEEIRRLYQNGSSGYGFVSDPLFVDPDNEDYHLLSERGRYWPEHDVWVLDKITSPCIDGGDLNADYSNEPTPNGGRINMGAYGGTPEASMSPWQQSRLPGQASNPNPAYGAGVFTRAKLSWTAGLNTISHDVYFGISDPPPFIRNQTEAEFDPGSLDLGTTYYWRIDEVNSSGKTSGPVWTFTYIPPPKSRACFTGDTGVWVDGALMQISNVVSGQMAGGLHCDLATDCLEQIETVEEHEGTFECRDIVLESGNRISVVDAHCFMLDSGEWIAAQDLRSGLRLKTLSGTVGIKSVATRAVPFVGKVYNLKVTGVDRYLVSEDGVIVRDY